MGRDYELQVTRQDSTADATEKVISSTKAVYFKDSCSPKQSSQAVEAPDIKEILRATKTMSQSLATNSSRDDTGSQQHVALSKTSRIQKSEDDQMDMDMVDLDTSELLMSFGGRGGDSSTRNLKSCSDFKSEEEWTAYQETQSIMAQSSFSVPSLSDYSEWKPSHGKQGGSKKRKMNNEFDQLDKMYQSKYGKGLKK